MAHNKKEKETKPADEIKKPVEVEIKTEDQKEEEVEINKEEIVETVETENKEEIEISEPEKEKAAEELPKLEDEEKQEDDDDFEEEESLTYWEKLVRFENTTKIGLSTAFIILLAVIFSWDWINHTWWLILILAGVSLRNLHKQRIELDEEKPFEAKIANVSFFITLFMLIIRDLAITISLDNSIEQLSQLFK